MWAYSPQDRRNWLFFWYKIAQKGYTLSAIFTKFGLREGVPSLHPHTNFHCSGFKKCGPTAPKSAKNRNFWYKFTPMGKFWGPTEKVGYTCTTTNIPVCNDTIIVLKKNYTSSPRFRYHKLRNSKGWQKNKNKSTSHFLVYSRRATYDPHYTWHGDREGPSNFCTCNFFWSH